jgi:hypothetical protein
MTVFPIVLPEVASTKVKYRTERRPTSVEVRPEREYPGTKMP